MKSGEDPKNEKKRNQLNFLNEEKEKEERTRIVEDKNSLKVTFSPYIKNFAHFTFVLLILVIFSCGETEDNKSNDCAGKSSGNSICGCTDSLAVNYLFNATHDDGSCIYHIDNGDFFLDFSGDDYVDIDDVFPERAYTKVAWVKRKYSYGGENNIISGIDNHALYAPYSQGAKLSAGHNGNYKIVQDTDSLPTGEWTFVAVSFDPDSGMGTMALYKNGIQVDLKTDVPTHNQSSKTFIGRFGNGNNWSGSIDEVALWSRALSPDEVKTLFDAGYDLTNTSIGSEKYKSLPNLIAYWRMNEGEGSLLSDASNNGNTGMVTGANWATCNECGCMDPSACNYDPSAKFDNRFCSYDDDACDECVDGIIVSNDLDNDGRCDQNDDDKDGDGVEDINDSHPYVKTLCADSDNDGCDDCSSGYNDPFNDGPDDDDNGVCNSYIIKDHTVYIVGSSYNSEGVYTSCYWIDGVRYELPGDGWTTDIVVDNGDVYISGTASNACYWINQQRYDLPGNGGEAEAIAVHENDVYVAGWFNNGSCYWKNGQKINLTTNAESQAFAIGVRENGMVYIGGSFMNNHHYIIPCFWKDGNNRTSLPIPSGGDGEVYDIAIMDGNMRYYAGFTMRPDNFAGYKPKAAFWRHTTRTDLPLGGSNMEVYGGEGRGITTDGDDVYVAGWTNWFEYTGQEETTGGDFPQYWKNNKIRDLEGGPLTEFGKGAAWDIRVANGNILVVGVATRDTSYSDSYVSPCYWLNGELNYLVHKENVPDGVDDWYMGEAKGVFIVAD